MNIPRTSQNFYSFTMKTLREFLVQFGKEKFRAEQLFRWVYIEGVTDFNLMTNLSKAFREELTKVIHFELPQVVSHLKSEDGTQKLLLNVGDKKTIEAVLIPSDGRLTLCVSSEVGCNMACQFCYTGKIKLSKRLSVDQIVGQYLRAREVLAPEERISNIVFMGMGEPLDNPQNVFPAIEILHETFGINLSLKKITVSTSGLVPQMPLITEAGVRLAVSLNASNDEVRSQIMPINKKYPIKELLDACREHCRETKDKVTLEYVLLKGVTDSLEHAHELYHLTKSVPCKINIIPFNEHPGADFLRPSMNQVYKFQQELINLGAHVLLRKTMGRDIFAACGQLTSFYQDRPEKLNVKKPIEGNLHA
ncbi:MAG: 23S rRNA (adenine(2503)-C(2))-methyltransferase RlmN [Pseudomonadota bacterium]|nr:23S rRNA (adenine(2503)-C(2))-methyltransferase RlmN [Pseudomonadota bacterium]